MADEFVEWVKRELKIYPESDVRNYFIKRGYPQDIVDRAIAAAKEGGAFPVGVPDSDKIKTIAEPEKENPPEREDTSSQDEAEYALDVDAKSGRRFPDAISLDSVLEKKKYIMAAIAVIVASAVFYFFYPALFSGASENGAPYYASENPGAGGAGIQACDASCFEERFKECAPSATGRTSEGGISFSHMILKKVGRTCEIATVAESGNASIRGKRMVCKYSMDREFSEAFKNPVSCRGELRRFIKSFYESANKGKSSGLSAGIDVDYEERHDGIFVKKIGGTVYFDGKPPVRIYLITGYSREKPDIPGPNSMVSVLSLYQKKPEGEGVIYAKRRFPIREEGDFSFYFYVYDCEDIEKKLPFSAGMQRKRTCLKT